ncbi:MAG: hypothetical protein R3C46_07610 [Hyphomonadaceae bacterium]
MLFFVVVPLCAAVGAAITSKGSERWPLDFLCRWLSLMPIMWAFALGPWQGLRLAAAIGYSQSVMGWRLLELAIVAASIAACAFALGLLLPGNAYAFYGPLFGAAVYAAMMLIGFLHRLVRR